MENTDTLQEPQTPKESFWESLPDHPILRLWREQELKRQEEIRAMEEADRLLREERERIWQHRHMQQNTMLYFMTEACCLRFDPKEKIPSSVLYDSYCRWCQEQDLFPETLRSFCLNLKRNATKYRIAPTNFLWQGRHIRGFRGVALTEDVHA